MLIIEDGSIVANANSYVTVQEIRDYAKKYKKDAKVKGEVVKTSDFGVFVKLEPGVEGLIHMTKIPPEKRLNVGDSVNVYVEEVDTKARKLSLGLVLTAKPVGYR